MRADIWQTNFGGIKKTHCNIVIEEITITAPADIKRAKALTDKNYHNEVRQIATKYTDNQLFKDMVTRIAELDDKFGMTDEELAEHQALIAFSSHFRIVF